MFTTYLYMCSNNLIWFDILQRMGWNYDVDKENGKIIINVPYEDEEIFNFIFY